MTGFIDAERVLDAFLAPEHDQLADRVLEAALADIARTPQRRALRAPWRFPQMPQFLRYAVVAVVLVAVAGVGGAFLVGRSGYVGPGAVVPTPTPSPTPRPTAPPAQGITSWTPYTSEVYGITFGVPDGWRQYAPATRRWQAGDASMDGIPYQESFLNPADRDGEDVSLGVWQQPAGSGADLTSRDGLAAWVAANQCDPQFDACDTIRNSALPMCLGKVECLPAILVPYAEGLTAVFADPGSGFVTVVGLGRGDTYPATSRYGGGIQLLKSILTTMDVWTPEPGQMPSGG